ncbi:MAG: discoidin domain-containing protein [Fibromonadales bacterium]|nr:discoidin domain-containing protein [Fibromonadales bacterium]
MCRIFLFFAISFAFAQVDILVNVVGYEKNGAKRAVIQSSSAISATTADVISGSTVVHTINLGAQTSVSGWSGRVFRIADFSNFEQDGKYRLRVGSTTSPEFSIGEKILQRETGSFQIGFFKGMRHTGEGDRNLAIYGGGGTHNIYGGWWDATGDPGKHLSHLSYANYFNPQQIPLVVWALLQANEFQPEIFGTTAAKEEIAWGADYLMRSLSKDNYFYMSVFDNWGGWNGAPREICAWGDLAGITNGNSDGVRSTAYQSAMREGGGVSIAALARASKAGISKDSSAAQYLAGAKRAYDHLKANPTRYQDNGRENIIDDYTGLLAATELYNATNEEQYLLDAQQRATSLLARQSADGWFYTEDAVRNRPFYHAADEGFPIVALVRYIEVCKPGDSQAIHNAIKKNFSWYKTITYQDPNPFEYVKMYGTMGGGADPGSINIARNGTATASRSEGGFTPDKVLDGGTANDSRWSSYQNDAENDGQWIVVDLGEVYKVNKVILRWEAAFGKDYRIEVSVNNSNWTTVSNVTENTQVTRTHDFSPVDARYVRMFGVRRQLEYGGFSLYEFEIYGEQERPSVSKQPARFFMPQTNETGYWWQGENARIASLSAAFTMGSRLIEPNVDLWYKDTLFAMAYAQLDWILGRNPFAASMMHGFGEDSYPNYPGLQALSNIKGGICNGITAKRGNESDLEWSNGADGANWRWIEQWLPHNAWYLTAISALSYRIDKPADPLSIKNNFANISNFKILIASGNISVELPFAANNRTSIDIYNMRGQKLISRNVPAGNSFATIEMPSNIAHGVYLLKVGGVARKFIYGN